MSSARISKRLQQELKQKMSLTRLAKTGFFKRADVVDPSVSRELLLHRAVLDKALIDSFSSVDDTRLDVEEWLDINNEDFLFCCDLAMLEPESVFNAFKEFKGILKGNKARFRRFGKKHNTNKEEKEKHDTKEG